jgi:Putative glycosyl/glycerophosphate transferases involved in teichoic acid biosynthesis TagF/TagB/EpsJ/RodC
MPIPTSVRKLGKLPGRIAERLLAGIFSLVSLIVPRSRRIWAFGSWYGLRFADNPKHLFLYCSAISDSPVFPVWISHSPAVIRRIRQLGLRAHHWLSPIGMWYSLRAGVYLIDCRTMDISSIASSGATIVNLWHGVPLKKIEGDIEQEDHPCVRARRGPPLVRMAYRLLRPQHAEPYDLVLGTSAVTAARFQSAFGVSSEQVVTLGYPRNDPLFDESKSVKYLLPEERDIIAEMRSHKDGGSRVLLYMPTFRDWNNNADRTIPIDWAELDAALEAGGGVLYCKLHPSDQARLPSLDGSKRIHLVPSGIDIYPALRYTDALITDYSSIFFDYLLLDRPIVFYPYDLEDYQKFSRTLYDPYDDVTPGPKACSARGLRKLIAELLDDYPGMADRWRGDRIRVRERAHEFADGRSAERFVAALLERLPA